MTTKIIKAFAAAALVIFAGSAVAQFDDGSSIDELALKNTNSSNSNPAPVLGAGVTWTGTTVGGVSWDRPIGNDCTSISGLGPVVASTQEFYVDTTGAYNFSSVQEFDGYIFLYEAPFDPTNQCQGFVAGDDDGAGGIGTSEILAITLDANVQYIAVTTGFGAGDEGTFENSISGAGGVFLGAPLPEARTVPTLSPFGLGAMLLVLGLVAAVVLVRRS